MSTLTRRRALTLGALASRLWQSGSLWAKDISDKQLVDWVQRATRKVQPTRAERSIDRIGWAGSITEALELARKAHRPVFVFSHDGSVSTGRC